MILVVLVVEGIWELWLNIFVKMVKRSVRVCIYMYLF